MIFIPGKSNYHTYNVYFVILYEKHLDIILDFGSLNRTTTTKYTTTTTQ